MVLSLPEQIWCRSYSALFVDRNFISIVVNIEIKFRCAVKGRNEISAYYKIQYSGLNKNVLYYYYPVQFHCFCFVNRLTNMPVKNIVSVPTTIIILLCKLLFTKLYLSLIFSL